MPGQSRASLAPLLLLLALCARAGEDEFAPRGADRAAIERVYYAHRTGAKPRFEETLPPAMLESLVRQDFKQERVLREHYGLAITAALLDAEIQRINATTRAPEMLAEIKAALGQDAARFAEAFAKPLLVARLLRGQFDNDDALHAEKRHQAERVRAQLLAARAAGGKSEIRNPKSERNPMPGLPRRSEAEASGDAQAEAQSPVSLTVLSNLVAVLLFGHSNEVSETTWELTARPAPAAPPGADDLEIKRRFGPDAQLIASPRKAEKDRKHYFEELPGALQKVLGTQLRQPGDVSAVIETPGAFLLYVAREKTATTLTTACLALPKRNYEQWLDEQK